MIDYDSDSGTNATDNTHYFVTIKVDTEGYITELLGVRYNKPSKKVNVNRLRWLIKKHKSKAVKGFKNSFDRVPFKRGN